MLRFNAANIQAHLRTRSCACFKIHVSDNCGLVAFRGFVMHVFIDPVVAEPEGLVSLMPRPANGHDH